MSVDQEIQKVIVGWSIPIMSIVTIIKELKSRAEMGESIEDIAPSVLLRAGAVKV